MASCKDCIHYDVCQYHITEETNMTVAECSYTFQNKADVVEVVRCKDCKHRGDFGCPMYHEEDIEWDDDGYTECEVIIHDYSRDDAFCSDGERSETNAE